MTELKAAEVRESLIRYIADDVLEGRAPELDGATPLLEWGILNSLEIVRLLEFIEQRFGVSIGFDQVVGENFKNLDSVTRLVISTSAGSPA